MNICECCGVEFEPNSKFNPNQKYCTKSCKAKAAYYRSAKPRFIKQRKELVLLLGGRCVLCGTSDYFVLAIDHINNDRCKDHEKWCDDRQRNRWILNHLDKAKESFQILCHNCNNLKQFYPEEYKKRLVMVQIPPSLSIGGNDEHL